MLVFTDIDYWMTLRINIGVDVVVRNRTRYQGILTVMSTSL